MDRPYRKTEAGRRAIRERAVALTRPARNLLLIIEPSRHAEDWLDMVAGSSETDLLQLLSQGLIEVVDEPPPARQAATPPAAAPAVPASVTLVPALQALDYQTLYDLLTSQARPRLGLIKGYRSILEIEKCSGLAELRALVPRFVAQVIDAQGEAGLRELAQQLPRGSDAAAAG